jgi:urease accessory protein UreE
VLIDPPDAPHVCIAVNILECPLVIAQPRSLREWTSLAYELGDLHIPMQVKSDQIISVDDGPVLGVLDRLRVPYRTEVGRFEPTHGTSSSVVPISESFRMIRSAS